MTIPSREKLVKILDLTTMEEPNGERHGFDTYVGSTDFLIDAIKDILYGKR